MSPEAVGRVCTLKLDGRDVTGRTDQSVLEVAREHGVSIPTLCDLPGLEATGGCRLCLVEIKGARRPLPACVTAVTEGMEVTTVTPALTGLRRAVVELLLAERNHVCSVCVSNRHCELQDMAVALGVDHVRVPYRYPALSVDASHPRFLLDHNRCILCARCVRVCDEIEGARTWDVAGRGEKARVVTDLATAWSVSDTCTGCGKCVQVCPTGALSEKGRSVAEMAKRRGFLPSLAAARSQAR